MLSRSEKSSKSVLGSGKSQSRRWRGPKERQDGCWGELAEQRRANDALYEGDRAGSDDFSANSRPSSDQYQRELVWSSDSPVCEPFRCATGELVG